MEKAAIKLECVSKSYKLYSSPKRRLYEALHPLGKKMHREFVALKDINLEVKRGEVLGIVGKNGCGKSTLLKLISGIIQPSTGVVSVRGKVSALLELGSGFNPDFTGIQNIYFYGLIVGLSRKEIDELLNDILSFADIGEYIDQPLKIYSSGMKARLAFSVATAIHPEILILDEILSVGDAQFRKKSARRMQSLMGSGTTVLLVSHSEDSINRLCSSAVYIRDGEVVTSGKPKHVTKLYLKVSGTRRFISNQDVQREMDAITRDEANADQGEHSVNEDESFYSEQVYKYSRPVITENFPVQLTDISIMNSAGKKVNILTYGKEYRLELKYRFDEPATDLVFPVAFFTAQEQLIFGVRNPDDGSSIDIDANNTVCASFNFKCNFLHGNYHLAAGVTRLGAYGEKSILLRIHDVLSYTVLNSEDRVHWGIISPGVRNMALDYHGGGT